MKTTTRPRVRSPRASALPPPLPVTPDALGRHPQIASLELLDAAIHIANMALIVEHPALVDEGALDIVEIRRPAFVLAGRLAARVHAVQQLLKRYRFALEMECPSHTSHNDDDIPF